MLGDWLGEHEVTHAVMESTGVYWKPVWHVLESMVDLALANANEVKNLPGRKSDVNDAQWLADLLAHGLLKRSFVPEREVEELRQLTRTRTQLVREAARHAARIDKVLQDANIKMRSVLTKVLEAATAREGAAGLRAGPSSLLAAPASRLGRGAGKIDRGDRDADRRGAAPFRG